MMGLGDRVEAWARRFGVPPPQDAHDDEQEQEAARARGRPRAQLSERDDRPGDGERRGQDPRPRTADHERFQRGVRQGS